MRDWIVEQYRRWSECVAPHDLELMQGECLDSSWKIDAFYRELAFGTGGLRGKIGMGPNRMNVYTVGKASQGLSAYLKCHFSDPSVVVCRDSRIGGLEFVKRAAEVFSANGVRVFIFPRPEPTPALSYAVRKLTCSAGVNITASHNPADYNGYKVYGADGCQITVETARTIQDNIDCLDPFDSVSRIDFNEAVDAGLIEFVHEDLLDDYVDATLSCSTGESISSLKVAYTPLNGAGLECVTSIMKLRNVKAFNVVAEQAALDGRFPTCPYPNPEVLTALNLGVDLCVSSDSDLLIATDPDADRLGVSIREAGGCIALSGNEIGLLLLEYLAKHAQLEGKDISRMVAITTIVSSPMADDVAASLGFELRRTLTGFKYIGEQIGLLDGSGRGQDFLFGFEESCGYLAGTHVRDKDGVLAALLVCELAAYWKARGLSLFDVMQDMYSRYGHWANRQISIKFDGPEGAQRMDRIMADIRNIDFATLLDSGVLEKLDYSSGAVMPVVNPSFVSVEQRLPSANVLEFRLKDSSRILVRPSGTEPKIKAYIFAKGCGRNEAEAKADDFERTLKAFLSN